MVGVLGPGGVRVCSRETTGLPKGRRSRLLLMLALERGNQITDSEVIERLWGTDAPRTALASLRNMVFSLRHEFGAETVVRGHTGYRLGVCRLDHDDFRELTASARVHAHGGVLDAALQHLDAALQLVRGRPFDDIADESWASHAVAEIADEIALVEEFWAELRLRTGHADREVERLHHAARAHPHREVRWSQLIAALAASGRRTEALRAADEARRCLAEFGLVPGRSLVAMEASVAGVVDVPISLIPVRRGPIVGRAQQLADLGCRAPITWIEGEAGYGKTRLVAEYVDRSSAIGHTSLYVACRDEGTTLLGPLARAVVAQCPTARVPIQLAALVEPHHALADSTRIDRSVRRHRITEALVQLLTDIGRRAPTTVIVDDVHWLDDDGAAIVAGLIMGSLRDVRWVFAGRRHVHNPHAVQLLGELERGGAVQHITLDGLSLDDLRDLLSSLASDLDESTSVELINHVHGAAGGHPLFATELLLHRLGGNANGTVPPRLGAIVAGTLRTLSDDDHRIVELMAAGPVDTALGVIGAATGCTSNAVLASIERLQDAGFVAPFVDGVVEFRHQLIRDIISNSIAASVMVTRRAELIDAMSNDPRYVTVCADLYVRLGHVLEPAARSARDAAVSDALERLDAQMDHARAASLARRYLGLGDAPTDDAGLRAHIGAARALIASDDALHGRAVLASLMGRVRRSGDTRLIADVLLVSGVDLLPVSN